MILHELFGTGFDKVSQRATEQAGQVFLCFANETVPSGQSEVRGCRCVQKCAGCFAACDNLAALQRHEGSLFGKEKALFSRMDGQLEPDTKESHSGHLLYG